MDEGGSVLGCGNMVRHPFARPEAGWSPYCGVEVAAVVEEVGTSCWRSDSRDMVLRLVDLGPGSCIVCSKVTARDTTLGLNN